MTATPQAPDAAKSILCIGETMALVTPIEPVPLRRAQQFAIKAGGAESTVAMYVADAGHGARWASLLGDEPLGWRLLDEVRASGVDVDGVRTVPDKPTGTYFKDPGTESTIVYYYRAGSAASFMDASFADDIDWESTSLLHVTGITAGLSESCGQMLDAVITAAGSHGVPVSFDVNYRPGLWTVANAAPVLAALAARADIVFVGRDEAESLWGEGRAEALIESLAISGRLIVKDGGIGATEVWRTPDGIRSVFERAPIVEVVEHVGAGDAFCGGYLVAHLEGEGPVGRLRRGHDLAARALGSTHDFVPA